MVSVTVDHVIAKAAIQANKKREREQVKLQQAENMQKKKTERERVKALKAHTAEVRAAVKNGFRM
jgi:hypothetical protein